MKIKIFGFAFSLLIGLTAAFILFKNAPSDSNVGPEQGGPVSSGLNENPEAVISEGEKQKPSRKSTVEKTLASEASKIGLSSEFATLMKRAERFVDPNERAPETYSEWKEVLKELNDNPQESLESFEKLLSSKDLAADAQKNFIINLAMQLNLPNEQKSNFFQGYIAQGVVVDETGLSDKSMSVVTAIDFFHKVTDPSEAEDKIRDSLSSLSSAEKKEILLRYNNYYPDISQRIASELDMKME